MIALPPVLDPATANSPFRNVKVILRDLKSRTLLDITLPDRAKSQMLSTHSPKRKHQEDTQLALHHHDCTIL